MITNDLLNFKIKHKDGTITYQPFLSEQDVKDFKNEIIDVMQSTGLYDRNSNLIYDGDTIKAKVDTDDGEIEFTGVVHYENGGYYVIGRDFVCGLGENSKGMEVQDGEARQDATTIQ